MKTIAFLGLGAMGRRMAARLLKAEYSVRVWNRSADVCEQLTKPGAVLAGAISAPTPKDAATGADVVLAMVRDNDASQSVWLDPEVGALAGMSSGSLALECSTITGEWAKTLGARLSDAGVGFLEAPVSGSRPHAEAGQLVFLVGGDSALIERERPLFESMGSAVSHCGPLGAGAQAKLATNTLMGVQLTALAELIGELKRQGADVEQVLSAVASTPVWSGVAGYLSSSMMHENFSPLFPVALIEKDFGYALAQLPSSQAPTLTAARNVFRAGIEAGYGEDNMTSIVRLFTSEV